MKLFSFKYAGQYSRERAGGGVPVEENWRLDRSGFREGRVFDTAGEAVKGALVGCLHMPTRMLVGHDRTDDQGRYRIDGLRPDVGEYLMIAYPEERVLGGEFEAATRWVLE